MDTFQTVALLISLAAVFAYLNHCFVKMPMSIGLMLFSMLLSLALLILVPAGVPAREFAQGLVGRIDFNKVLLEGMLGLLLFAGALHVNINDLEAQKLEVGVFASLGVLSSTLLLGGFVYLLSWGLDLGLNFISALLFGALISPTDPIAVLSILKTAGAPRSLETKIAGESLFNDGIGVVVFLVLLEFATGDHGLDPGHVFMLFATETIGGILFGLASGYLVYRLLKTVNCYQVEILLTLALVLGGYALALALRISGPLAMVVAGLLIGNRGRRLAMSETTRLHLDSFWELIDDTLNALLFVLIGLEVLVLTLSWPYLTAGLLAVPVALLARWISVGIPICLLKRWRPFAPHSIRVMTWGGLRGGISIALALSLPVHRELLLTMSYVVVAFSIVVQGLTIKRMV